MILQIDGIESEEYHREVISMECISHRLNSVFSVELMLAYLCCYRLESHEEGLISLPSEVPIRERSSHNSLEL